MVLREREPAPASFEFRESRDSFALRPSMAHLASLPLNFGSQMTQFIHKHDSEDEMANPEFQGEKRKFDARSRSSLAFNASCLLSSLSAFWRETPVFKAFRTDICPFDTLNVSLGGLPRLHSRVAPTRRRISLQLFSTLKIPQQPETYEYGSFLNSKHNRERPNLDLVIREQGRPQMRGRRHGSRRSQSSPPSQIFGLASGIRAEVWI